MDRRRVLTALAWLGVAGLAPARAFAIAAQPPVLFSRDTLWKLAETLAASGFVEPETALSGEFSGFGYDRYRDIVFKPERRVWPDGAKGFQVEPFHRGAIYKQRVDVHVVENGEARRLVYNADDFSFGLSQPGELPRDDIGFSGFRAYARINSPRIWDEFLVFQGASYFRAVAKGTLYGLSARALALKTGSSEGEEFPTFRSLWVEAPAQAGGPLTIHGLLDSPSTTGAYSFAIQPGDETRIAVSGTLFPRVPLPHVGLAPLTSMYQFGPLDSGRFDDIRSAVHDSDGLLIRQGDDRWSWRPLANPRRLQISSFSGDGVTGFGLDQRERRFAKYEDLAARYEKRPSAWVQRRDGWLEGAIELIEIPTLNEFNDNIVAYWRPKGEIPAGRPFSYSYDLIVRTATPRPPALFHVAGSRVGAYADIERHFVVDFVRPNETPLNAGLYAAEVTASAGEVKAATLSENPEIGGYRLSFRLRPSGDLAEIVARLTHAGRTVSETWLYRWTSA